MLIGIGKTIKKSGYSIELVIGGSSDISYSGKNNGYIEMRIQTNGNFYDTLINAIPSPESNGWSNKNIIMSNLTSSNGSDVSALNGSFSILSSRVDNSGFGPAYIYFVINNQITINGPSEGVGPLIGSGTVVFNL